MEGNTRTTKNVKLTRKRTLALAILTLHAHHLWMLWFLVVGVIHREGDWYFWGISTASALELALWRNHALFGFLVALPVLFSPVLCVFMFVYYFMLEERRVSLIPYYVLLGLQAGSFVAAILTKLFTAFGIYWAIINGAIFVLVILAIVSLSKLRSECG